jgi:glycosyltransferase involved in cell wall biosynthesis
MAGESRIRVLEVIQQGEIGGGESHLLTLINKMDRDRFEPVVVALSDGKMIRRLTEAGIKNYVVNSPYPFNITIWNRIKKILRENQISLIHTHGARALSNVIYPARQLSIPVVHTVHGWSFHDHLPPWKQRLRIAGEKFLTSKATFNIAVSASNQRIALEKFGSFNGKVINNGVDLSIYDNAGISTIRTEFGIPGDAVLISFVSRFIHDKNPLPLIRAFSRIQDIPTPSYLIMVGDGPARSQAIELAKDLGVEFRVIFPGFRSDVPSILAASDIFCLPSIKEGLPVSLIEAMAMHNAVIATNVQGCIDVVTDGEDGLLVSLERLEDDLVNALRLLLEQPDKRKQFAEKARRTVEERFNAVHMAEKIETLYLDILNKTKSMVQPP